MEKIFDSKYPIVEAGMNPASTLELALAVHEAGAFPCIALWAYLIETESDTGTLEFKPDIPAFDAALNEFVRSAGTNHLLVTLFSRHIFNLDVFNVLAAVKPRVIEVVMFDRTIYQNTPEQLLKRFLICAKDHPIFSKYNWPVTVPEKEKVADLRADILRNVVAEYRKIGVRTMIRSHEPRPIEKQGGYAIDGLFIKGFESGGRNARMSVWENFSQQIAINPSVPCIPFGGIGAPEHVKKYIDAGAQAVGVGTLFAASKESPLSMGVKERMVAASKRDISKIGETGQNALVFSKLTEPDDFNSNRSLRMGLFGDGTTGHVYAGHAIDHVKEIRPVKEIVEYLVSEL